MSYDLLINEPVINYNFKNSIQYQMRSKYSFYWVHLAMIYN